MSQILKCDCCGKDSDQTKITKLEIYIEHAFPIAEYAKGVGGEDIELCASCQKVLLLHVA